MLDIIQEALKESLELVPFLLVIYFGIAWLEYRYEDRIQIIIRKAGKAGPLLGAMFGCLPQCGFSVVGSALYTRRLITTGTLLSVFISTSDEAVPIIMAHPERMWLILPLLGTKVALALLAGFLVDVFARQPQTVAQEEVALQIPVTAGTGHVHTDEHHEHTDEHTEPEAIEVDGCCGHHLPEENKTRSLLVHPLLHTAQVFLVLFIVTIGINVLVGEEGARLSGLLLHGSFWQPIITAFVGLIPNCGASVAITEVYLRGGIGFGAVIAGLSSSAGLGLLVLLKDNHNLKDTLRILALLLAFSIGAGILIQWVVGLGVLPGLR